MRASRTYVRWAKTSISCDDIATGIWGSVACALPGPVFGAHTNVLASLDDLVHRVVCANTSVLWNLALWPHWPDRLCSLVEDGPSSQSHYSAAKAMGSLRGWR